ncbi:hypothetical protein Q3G72_033391 [Acer saccharum]|nr:hypothetical protein Q3G72_033391 [Acer saccharum]
MVFHSLVQSNETTPPPPPLSQQQPPVSMASPITVKSQQQQQSSLHNFVLPELKWTVSSNVNAYRSSRNYQPPPPPPRNEAGSDSEKTEKSEKMKSDADSASDSGRTKFVIRIRSKNSKIADEADHVSAAEYMVQKSWNFRPRKAVTKTKVNNNGYGSGGAVKIGGAAKATQGPTPSVKAPAAKNNEKPKFSISLTKEEIEEDFLAMTGSKPPRKAQKRARSVQKQLDYVFPGLWLDSITPDSYRVDDGRSKFRGETPLLLKERCKMNLIDDRNIFIVLIADTRGVITRQFGIAAVQQWSFMLGSSGIEADEMTKTKLNPLCVFCKRLESEYQKLGFRFQGISN